MYDKRKIKEIPEENRPYEKCLRLGVQALTDEELLAVLLRSGSKDSSALDIAHKVLHLSKDKKGLQGLYQLSIPQLKSIRGVGTVRAVQLKCIGELSKRIAVCAARKGISFDNPGSVAEYYMEQLRHRDTECVYLLNLDNKGRMLSDKRLSDGSVRMSLISPREIFLEALRSKAVSIILIHNHPSGDCTPSQADVDMTEQIAQKVKYFGFNLRDHIIIGDNRYFSFYEHNIIT